MSKRCEYITNERKCNRVATHKWQPPFARVLYYCGLHANKLKKDGMKGVYKLKEK